MEFNSVDKPYRRWNNEILVLECSVCLKIGSAEMVDGSFGEHR